MARRPPRAPDAPLRPELVLEGASDAISALAAGDSVEGLVWTETQRTQVRTAHYDTEDQALAAAGLLLTVATDGGHASQILRRAPRRVVGYAAIVESRSLLTGPAPDLSLVRARSLRAAARAAAGERVLQCSAERELVQTNRRASLDGVTLTAAFQQGQVTQGRARREIARVVLATREGDPAALFRLALILQAKHESLRPARDEGETLRPAAASERIAGVRTPRLSRRATVAELIERLSGECLERLSVNTAAVLEAPRAESVHLLRVATRRMRSTLRLLRAELPSERSEWLRAALSPVADALGVVRDRDVFLELLTACEAEGAPSLAALRERMALERAGARAEVQRLLESPEFARLELELGAFVLGTEWRTPERSVRLAAPAAQVARALVLRAAQRARKAGRGFAKLAPPDRHQLRLRVKAARYAAELLASQLPRKRARRYARRAAELQDLLGIESDAARARVLLEGAGATSEGAGFVRGYCAGVVAKSRLDARRAWRRFRAASPPWD